MLAPLVVGLAGAVGLAVGSFLTVVASRVPAGESIVRPRSHCPSCRTTLHARDNVPVLSYLALGGRCRSCRVQIPARYLLIELATGGLFCAVAARVADPWAAAAYGVLAATLVALCAVDLERMRLPTSILATGGALGAALLLLASATGGHWHPVLRAAVAAAVCGGAFLLAWLALPQGIGLGDVRLATLCAGFLGWLGYRSTAVGFLVAFLAGGAVAVALVALGRAGRKSRLPFGPFLGLGAMVGVLFGSPLAHLWLA